MKHVQEAKVQFTSHETELFFSCGNPGIGFACLKGSVFANFSPCQKSNLRTNYVEKRQSDSIHEDCLSLWLNINNF